MHVRILFAIYCLVTGCNQDVVGLNRELGRFPSPAVVQGRLDDMIEFHEKTRGISPRDWPLYDRRKKVIQVYGKLISARAARMGYLYQRSRADELRDQIGAEAYSQGRLPAPVLEK